MEIENNDDTKNTQTRDNIYKDSLSTLTGPGIRPNLVDDTMKTGVQATGPQRSSKVAHFNAMINTHTIGMGYYCTQKFLTNSFFLRTCWVTVIMHYNIPLK